MQLATELSENTFYPDLTEKGGLIPALQAVFSEIQSSLKVQGPIAHFDHFPVYARVESRNRFSQIYIGVAQRMFIFDFWQSGIMLGNARTESLSEVADVLSEWLESPVFLSELADKHVFINLQEKTRSFEEASEADWQWRNFEETFPEQHPSLVAFLAEARESPVLRQLFPYTSLNQFCFSRCTGYPYSSDCPYVAPSGDCRYQVFDASRKLIGEGNAKEAVTLVVTHLPANCGRALRGTKEDL